MKCDFISMLKNLLKKSYIIILAVILGCCFGVGFNKSKTINSPYISQIFVDQDFMEKHPVAGVQYLDSVESKTKTLINNSVVALKSIRFLKTICEDVGVSVQNNDIINNINIKKVSDNVIEIAVDFGNAQKSKEICEKIVSLATIQLNTVIMNNIDPVTQGFKEGTAESNKITVSTYMGVTAGEQTAISKSKILIIFALIGLFASLVVLILVDLIKNKVRSAYYVHSKFNIPTIEADSFAGGATRVLAEGQVRDTAVNSTMLCYNNVEDSEKQEFLDKMSKCFNAQIIEICENSDNVYKKEDIHIELSSDYVIENYKTVKDLVENNKFDIVIIVVNKCFKSPIVNLCANMTESIELFLKKNVDNLWDVYNFVDHLNDKQIKISDIICW